MYNFRAKVRNMFTKNTSFNWYVAIYIPGTTDVNKETNTGAYVRAALKVFAGEFGGATAQPCRGAWISDTQGLVLEKTTLVYAYAPKITDKNRRVISDFATFIKTELKQESVAIEYRKQDGGLQFV